MTSVESHVASFLPAVGMSLTPVSAGVTPRSTNVRFIDKLGSLGFCTVCPEVSFLFNLARQRNLMVFFLFHSASGGPGCFAKMHRPLGLLAYAGSLDLLATLLLVLRRKGLRNGEIVALSLLVY
jgi:hypothetical protein